MGYTTVKVSSDGGRRLGLHQSWGLMARVLRPAHRVPWPWSGSDSGADQRPVSSLQPPGRANLIGEHHRTTTQGFVLPWCEAGTGGQVAMDDRDDGGKERGARHFDRCSAGAEKARCPVPLDGMAAGPGDRLRRPTRGVALGLGAKPVPPSAGGTPGDRLGWTAGRWACSSPARWNAGVALGLPNLPRIDGDHGPNGRASSIFFFFFPAPGERASVRMP